MFRVGEKVVCIESITYNNSNSSVDLIEKDKIYTIKSIHSKFINKKTNEDLIVLEELDWVSVDPKKFDSGVKFRKEKIEKINKIILSL